MIFITDELDKTEKNIIELIENVGFKECKTIEAIDLFCGISEKNDMFKEKELYYAFIDMSWRESLCITMSSVTERISSRSMSISK